MCLNNATFIGFNVFEINYFKGMNYMPNSSSMLILPNTLTIECSKYDILIALDCFHPLHYYFNLSF